jgi:ABC-type phosphate transport system permease subunit
MKKYRKETHKMKRKVSIFLSVFFIVVIMALFIIMLQNALPSIREFLEALDLSRGNDFSDSLFVS